MGMLKNSTTILVFTFLFLFLTSCSVSNEAKLYNENFLGRIDSEEKAVSIKAKQAMLTITPEKAMSNPDYKIVENVAVPYAPEYKLGPGDVVEIIYHIKYEKTEDNYRLEVQDKISINFPFHPQFNCTVLVRTDGKISVPIIGDVQAESLTPTELAENLNRLYSKYLTNPSITVALEDFNVKIKELKRSITTAPRGQSKVAPIAPDGTISFPIIGSIHAEGLTLKQLEDKVNAEYAKQIRNLKTTLVLLEIHHNKFYIVGEVEKPGAYEITTRTNLLAAIATANGYRKSAHLEDVIVFRNYGLEKPVVFKVNLKKALKEGRHYAFIDVLPADIIYVPKSSIDNFNDLMEKIFTKGIYAILPFQTVFSINYDVR